MYVCPACLSKTLEGRFDKKGRPYMSCLACGMKMFPRMGNFCVLVMEMFTKMLEKAGIEKVREDVRKSLEIVLARGREVPGLTRMGEKTLPSAANAK